MAELFKEEKIKWFLLMVTFGVIAVLLNQSTHYQSTFRSFFREISGIYIQMADVGFSIIFSIVLTLILYFIAGIVYKILLGVVGDTKQFIDVVNPPKETLLDFIEFAPVDEDGNMLPIDNKLK